MNTVIVGKAGGVRRARPSLKIIRVAAGAFFVGEVHLDESGRVRRRADTVPSDVVLKLLIDHTRRGAVCGTVPGRADGREFHWFVVGALPEAGAPAVHLHDEAEDGRGHEINEAVAVGAA